MLSNSDENSTIERKKYRDLHGKMDHQKASSYSVMAMSKQYKKYYNIYIDFFIEVLKHKRNIRVLNLGFGSGILENIILSNFNDCIEFYSIDNSNTFYEIASSINTKYIDEGKIKLILMDIVKDEFSFNNFDVILSRDLNHHLQSLRIYLNKCYNCLEDDGILLMEDLRYDANISVVKLFTNLLFSIPELTQNPNLLYHKILGLIESFMASYNDVEVIEELQNTEFVWYRKNTNARYHFILSKRKVVLYEYKSCLNYLCRHEASYEK